MKTTAELTDLFRAQGLRVTPQRQAIFRLLHGNDRHPTRGIRDHRMRVLTRGHAGAHTDTESLQYGERVSVCEFCENLVEDACIRPFAADINSTGART